MNGLYDTFYTDQHGSGDDETWGFKPQVFAANHSTMDCQASGWDAEWQRHAWKPDKFPGDCMADELSCSGPCKPFLAGLETADASIFADSNSKTVYEAQARAIRGYNYLYLTKLFGRVPMLLTGETYTTSVGKARPGIRG